jgi:NADPH2:quinone reductase
MHAIRIKRPGSYDVLELVERPAPTPGADDLLVKVRAAGINRADCMQRLGTYPIPPGADWGDIPGLEVAGEVAGVGASVREYKVGDRVFGLLPHSGYAEYALVDRGLALPIPEKWDFVQAACIIETFATANETVFELGGLKVGETILIHAASSGVGSTALQMAKVAGATVFVTAGSDTKLARLRELGADLAINYKKEDFVAAVKHTSGEGVDLVLDFIGADYLARNLQALRETGRLVLVGLLGSDTCEFDIRIMLARRLTIRGFTLRAQGLSNKRKIVERVGQRWMPFLEMGRIKPIVHATFPLEKAAAAHELMEANANTGKIILTIG